MRLNQRKADELRSISITRQFTRYAEGSVLVCFGETKVICTASITPGVPRFLKGTNQGWLTAEYGMLPRATHDRTEREAAKGRQTGRTLEIQRLIGRSLRNCINLKMIGENTITIDCDVIQADGGTRTAAITGGAVALFDALSLWQKQNQLSKSPFTGLIASVSVGIHQGVAILDLDYNEDSTAETDMNVVMNESLEFIEVQGTAEKRPFRQEEFSAMLELATSGIQSLLQKQKEILTL